MKSSTLIASYLWKDTWSRWLEQPGSWLARVFVGLLLVIVATLVLVGLNLVERNLRAKLEGFGLNTLVIREMITPSDSELLPNNPRADRFATLDPHGERLRLRQLFIRAKTDWQTDLMAMTYDSSAMPIIGHWMSPTTSLVLLSDHFPEGTHLKVEVQGQQGTAVVRRQRDIIRPLSTENLLLIPQGWMADVERLGFVETTLFRRQEGGPALERFIGSINLLYTLDRRPAPQIQSPVSLKNELEKIHARQAQWRGILAAILGLVVALVYGSIAFLEFRQNLFVTALMRSFGTPSLLLFVRQWLENVFLTNFAAVSAVLLVFWLQDSIFAPLGFTGKAPGFVEFARTSEMVLILICVNIGAFLSALPVAAGLRRPVGAVLN